jgi:hypothetical protein
VHLVEDIQELELHLVQEDIRGLELLQVQEDIQEQERLQVLEGILAVSLELLEVVILVLVHLVDSQALQVVDTMEQVLQAVDILELVHQELQVVVTLELGPHQVNMEVPQLLRWTPRLPSGSKLWTRIRVAR